MVMILPINISALNNTIYMIVDPYKECFLNGQMKLECINRYICPQIPKYFVKTGFLIIIAYILISWLLWWFFRHGYKMIDYSKYSREDAFNRFVGDLREESTRIYWDYFIRDKLAKLLLGFVVVMVWLFWTGF